ncbi:uncharacterized protein NECHADRAFT_80104 [Fusarium vanettenii 77-13-4]|uniref:Uncharacterized protein n=1 Tax=Fusarium vanettenii (strain ATCC MYA-4622 / CBS 123669 / FGSC 9596 / NRRL 45880 / 77-13-4) TaxID=660122 RepID=C7Z139_FUSV7|nr:uncharacterized protein NECHADRAFT_80104 [Fusarium vanettenii 77-13-4]EEU42502.1 predicted protein [Fusarium vanettenii 77-13-4]
MDTESAEHLFEGMDTDENQPDEDEDEAEGYDPDEDERFLSHIYGPPPADLIPDTPRPSRAEHIPIPRENLNFGIDENAPAFSSIAFLVIMLEPEAPGGKCQWTFAMRNHTTDMWHSQVLYVSPGPEPELSVDVHYHNPTELPNYVETITFKERRIPHRTAARIIDACMAVKIPNCAHRECPSADYVIDVVEELERLGAIDLFDMYELLTQTAKYGINPLDSDEEEAEGGQ